MSTHKIQLKGLSPDQVDRLLPEGLISVCWRGSVAHGMYVPKSDPDSIDDKDVMGIYIGPNEEGLSLVLGLRARPVQEDDLIQPGSTGTDATARGSAHVIRH